MRKLGDPILKTKARPVERFDDELRDEVARMGALMHDALGIGLAAPQVGIAHRVLVYRVEPDSPIVALVNPEIEWSSRDEEISEEGCLSLPMIHVDVERPVAVLVNARDEHGAEIVIEATGLEARVIQHEIDHLDGILILDRTSREQRKAAMRALREAEQARAAQRSRDADRLPRHLGLRGGGPRPARDEPAPAAARRHPPRPARRAAGAGSRRRRWPTRRARWTSRCWRRRTSTPRTRASAIAAAAPDAVVVCAFGALIREPLLSDFEMLNVHPSLLPRWRGAAPVERAIMAGDEETGVCIMRVTAGLDSGPVFRMGREPIAPDDTYGTLTPRLQELAADLLLRVLDERPAPVEQTEDGVTYAEKIGPADRTLDPAASAAVNDRVVRALTPHIGARAALADGSFLGVLRAVVREPEAAGELRADGNRLLLGGLELLEVQPAGGRPMDAAAYLRGRTRS